MDSEHRSAFLLYLFWTFFGLALGLIIAIGTGQFFLSTLTGLLFGGGLALLMTRHIRKNHI